MTDGVYRLDGKRKVCYIGDGMQNRTLKTKSAGAARKEVIPMKKKINPKKLYIKKLSTTVDKCGMRGLRRPRA